MELWKYSLECGHVLEFTRKVGTKQGMRYCKRCHEMKNVVDFRMVDKFTQKKLSSFARA
jgi:hypothetical protein